MDQDAVQENVQRVMAELKGGSSGGGAEAPRSRRRTRRRVEQQQEERQRQEAEEAQTVRVNEFLTVAELAELIDEDRHARSSRSAFKNLGLMVTINQRLDFDQIELLLDEFGFKAVREEEYGAEMDEEEETRTAGGPEAASAGGDGHGSRGPRQDVAAGLHPRRPT